MVTSGWLGKFVMLHKQILVQAIRKNALQLWPYPLSQRPGGITQARRRIMNDAFGQPCYFQRIMAVLLFFLHHANATVHLFAIDAALFSFSSVPTIRGELSLKISRLNQHHPNAEWLYLHSERFGQALHGELAGAVKSLERYRHQSC